MDMRIVQARKNFKMHIENLDSDMTHIINENGKYWFK